MPLYGGRDKQLKSFMEKDTIQIEGMDLILEEVKVIEERKKIDPSYVSEDKAGEVILDGVPKMLVNNEYIDYLDAQIIFQKRAIAREFLKLQTLEAKKLNQSL